MIFVFVVVVAGAEIAVLKLVTKTVPADSNHVSATFLSASDCWEELGIETVNGMGFFLTCAEMKYELLTIVSRYFYLHFVAFMPN